MVVAIAVASVVASVVASAVARAVASAVASVVASAVATAICYVFYRQFSSLWEIGDTVADMNKGVDTHLSSLEHYGCSSYIKAGKLHSTSVYSIDFAEKNVSKIMIWLK